MNSTPILLPIVLGAAAQPLKTMGTRFKNLGRSLTQIFPRGTPEYKEGRGWIKLGKTVCLASDAVVWGAVFSLAIVANAYFIEYRNRAPLSHYTVLKALI